MGGTGVAAAIPSRIYGSSLIVLAALAPLAGCAAVGPDYLKPAAIVPAHYEEIKGWKLSTPRDDAAKGAWWRAFRDPELDRLEPMVAFSNQTLISDAANYREALALIAEARAGLFPTANFNPTFNHTAVGSIMTTDILDAEVSASWVPDLWGKVRRMIEQEGAAAQASAATLANAQLSEQTALAAAYVQLLEADSAHDLYADTVKQYQRSLVITQNQYDAGTAAKSDVITAQALVLAAQAQLQGVEVSRQQSEHAIAILIGRPPSELSIRHGSLADTTPAIPVSVPSTLLERRPDIAAAERTMADENAAIGVAIAGYYPSLTLSGAIGYQGNPFIPQIAGANPVSSLAAGLAQPLFNGGLTDAQVAAARAAYDSAVAAYRQTVLTAFQQVEDNLVALRVYGEEIKTQVEAVKAAKQAVQIALNEYAAGTQNYTTVVTAEATELTDQLTQLTLRGERLTAAVNLIVAHGGGWTEAKLPEPPI